MMPFACGRRDAFLQQLAHATSYRPSVLLMDFFDDDALCPTDYDVMWPRLKDKLLDVGAAYVAEYGRPPVLVVDGVDELYRRDPAVLTDLQTLAKNGADTNTLRVVFVVSETAAFEMLQSHPHSSQSKVFFVGDADDKEAVKFLVSSGVDEASAQDAVARITGGRIVLLNKYISDHECGLTNDQVLSHYHARTRSELRRAGFKKTDLSSLFREVSTGSLQVKRAIELVGDD